MENKKTEKQKLTPLSLLGEFGLIKHIQKDFTKIKNKSTIKGIGDDAAVLNAAGKLQVVTTDMLVEKVHFDLSYMPLKHLGYKSVIVNLSDVYAMNAQPKQITVSIAVSNRFPLEAVDEFYKGIELACNEHEVDLVGGDTTTSPTGMTISITAIGEVDADKVVYRNTAKENDYICVSGDLGGAYLGLQLLEREKEVFKANPNMQPELEGYEYILQKQLKPKARKDIIELLENYQIVPTSMIDISDGVSSEIIHICTESKVGARIYENKLPIDVVSQKMAKEFNNLDPTVCAMNGGEDYELLFTLSENEYEKIKNDTDISVIGRIVELSKGAKLIAKDTTEVAIQAQGWNALLNS